jgi:RNA polymerase sigma-70 factor (ECF subfamily)
MVTHGVPATSPSFGHVVELERERAHLRQLCYRMTGSASDAEDLVQEAFVRALESPPPDVSSSLRPWLVRVAMNLARDHLRRRKRRGYHGVWLPAPLETDADVHGEPVSPGPTPEARYTIMESASFAFLVALEALTPSQRAVLLLRDTFDYSGLETAEALGLSEENVRITLHRARKRMRGYDEDRPAFGAEARASATDLLQRFFGLLAARDLTGAAALLSDDVQALSDGGGVQPTARAPLTGTARVAKFFGKLTTKSSSELTVELRSVNGSPALVGHDPKAGKPAAAYFVILLDLDGAGRIHRIYSVVAPDKLRGVRFPSARA